MAEDLFTKCSTLSLDEDEGDIIDLGEAENTCLNDKIALLLIK